MSFEKVTVDPVPGPLLIIDTIIEAQKILRAVNNTHRLQIIHELQKTKREKEMGLTVSELIRKFRWEQSIVSQHLSILRAASVVKRRRDGKFMFYHINQDTLDFIMQKSIELCTLTKKPLPRS